MQNLSGLAKKSLANGKLSTIKKTKMTKKFSKVKSLFQQMQVYFYKEKCTDFMRVGRVFPCFRRCLLSQPEKCAVLRLKFSKIFE